jgi:hydroxymethylpyrimidine pyrophosphatase-like HAD family hydrolase
VRYLALASDYGGTLATEGQVYKETLDALQQLRGSGRKLILVTDRYWDDICQAFPQVDWFRLYRF